MFECLGININMKKLYPEGRLVIRAGDIEPIKNNMAYEIVDLPDRTINGLPATPWYIRSYLSARMNFILNNIEKDGDKYVKFYLSHRSVKFFIKIERQRVNSYFLNLVDSYNNCSFVDGAVISCDIYLGVRDKYGTWLGAEFEWYRYTADYTISNPINHKYTMEEVSRRAVSSLINYLKSPDIGQYEVACYFTYIWLARNTKEFIKNKMEQLEKDYQSVTTSSPSSTATQYPKVDINKIFILEDPPAYGQIGDLDDSNTIYEGIIYWPDDYLKFHVCDGDTIELTDVRLARPGGEIDEENSYWILSGKKTSSSKDIFRLRLLGIDAPEIDHWDEKKGRWVEGQDNNKSVAKSYPLGETAMRQLNKLIPHGTKVIIDACNQQSSTYTGETELIDNKGYKHMPYDILRGHDNYGRRLGIVYAQLDVPLESGKTVKRWVNINRTMIARGLAVSAPWIESGNTVCHRATIGTGRTPIQCWGFDNKLPISTTTEFLVSHHPIVYTPGTNVDDRDKFLGSFDPYYQVRIGDCQFVVPPEEITVSKISKSERIPTLRSRGSIRKDTGQYITRVQMVLYFSGIDELNGFEVQNIDEKGKPRAGSKGAKGINPYYINGLRSLIAQFKRTPFLPIENYYLNEIHNIDAVALQSLTLSTVPDFPDTFKVTVNMLEFDYMAYMPGELSFSACFDWPLFRYYYQTALHDPCRDGVNTDPHRVHLIDRTYLEKIDKERRNTNFQFYIANEIGLMQLQRMRKELQTLAMARRMILDNASREGKEGWWNNIVQICKQYIQVRSNNGSLDEIEAAINVIRTQLDEGPGIIPYEIDDLTCTGMNIYYENILSELQLQMTALPAYQYMGGQDTYIRASFRTSSEDTVKKLRQMHELTTRLTRQYSNILENSVLVIRNDYINLFGINTCAIEELNVRTVPDFPGVYDIDIVFVDVQRTARRMAELQQFACTAFKMPGGKDREALYRKALLEYFYPGQNLTEEEIAKKIEEMAPELARIIEPTRQDEGEKHLASYFKVVEALRRIELYPDLELPTYEDLRDVGFIVQSTAPTGRNQIFAEPDFYIHPNMISLGQQIAFALKQSNIVQLWDRIGSKAEYIRNPNLHDANSDNQYTIYDYIGGLIDPVVTTSRLIEAGTDQEAADVIYRATNSHVQFQPEKGDKRTQRLAMKYIDAFGNEHFRNGHKPQGYYSMHTLEVYLPGGDQGHADDPKEGDYVFLTGFGPEFALFNGLAFHIKKLAVNNGTIVDANGRQYPSDVAVYKLYIEDEVLRTKFNELYMRKNQQTSEGIKAIRTVKIPIPESSSHVFIETEDGTYFGKIKRMYFPFPPPQGFPAQKGILYFLGYPELVNFIGERREGREYIWPGFRRIVFTKFDISANASGKMYYMDQEKPATVYLDEILYNPITKEVRLRGRDLDRVMSDLPPDKRIFLGDISPFVVNEQELEQDRTKRVIGEFKKAIEKDPRFDITEFAAEGASEFYYDFGGGPDDNYFNTSPDKTFVSTFHDLVVYDKRNRLIRAFPTFHLSLIDEGRIIGQWKLHDNFYGFQAASSISVHKSRKIVADTCVIELVNTFKNLTSYDNENIDYYGRPTIWDAIPALFLSKDYIREKVEAHRPENLKSIFLKTGTRISLRMGYGSDAADLPVIFNGTITEIGGEDVVTIIAQGDGYELTNVITARLDATTGTWPSITSSDFFDNMFTNKTEPRHLICDMLTTVGGFWKKAINKITSDRFFNYNPLGIMHFGNPDINPNNWYGAAGECGQNIYRGRPKGAFRYNNDSIFANGDVVFCMSLYGKTPWDVIQTCAMVVPDFIASVVPFGFRSTIFYGKPYYNLVYDYDLYVPTNEAHGVRVLERRKAFQQTHIYTSFTDIINNDITASEDDIYTNVIGTYKTMNIKRQTTQGETPVIYADTDIWPEKQRTAIVDTSIVCRGWKPFELIGWLPGLNIAVEAINKLINCFTHEERVAERVARSALRIYLKDMYKGELMVVGDPTVKPYDLMYLADTKNEMSGLCEVKEVVHHFSEKTGFITSITPDLCVVNDDTYAMAWWNWIHAVVTVPLLDSIVTFSAASALKGIGVEHALSLAFGIGQGGRTAMRVGAEKAGEFLTTRVTPKIMQWIGKGTKGFTSPVGRRILEMELKETLGEKAFAELLEKISKSSADDAINIVKSTIEGLGRRTTSGKVVTGLQNAVAKSFGIAGPVAFIIETIIMEALCASIGEGFNRWARNRQAVIMLPLKKQGIKFTAGIQGHMGCVYGDAKSAWDILIEKWSSVMDWFFPGAKVEYARFREETQEIDPVSYLSYQDKISGTIASLPELNSGRQMIVNPLKTSVSSNIISKNILDQARLSETIYMRVVRNGRVDYDEIYAYNPDIILPSYSGLPPTAKSNPDERGIFLGATYNLKTDKLIGLLYGSKFANLNNVLLTKNGTLVLSSSCKIINDFSAPYLEMDAFRVLRDVVVPQLRDNLGDQELAIEISSAFRTPQHTRNIYIKKGSTETINGKPYYRFSDHEVGKAIDFYKIYYKGKWYMVKDYSRDSDTKILVKKVYSILTQIDLYQVFCPENDEKWHDDHFHISLYK